VLKDPSVFAMPTLVFDDNKHCRVGPLAARFPDDWADVLAIKYETLTVYNSQHPLYNLVTQESWAEYNELEANRMPRELVERAAQGPRSRAASFLLNHARRDSEFWNALRDNYSEELRSIFSLAGLVGSYERFRIWEVEGGVHTVSIAGSHFLEGRVSSSLPGSLLPVPTDPMWLWGRVTRGEK
jgi:hypothetical protein